MNHTEQSSAGNFQTEKDRHRVGKAQALSLPLKLPPVSAGAPQILKGCATPEVCHLQANTTLGPEASGFHLTTKPECNYVAPTTHPGALNPDFLRPYPFCPLWIPNALPDPMCSQGIPSPYHHAPSECNYPYARAHTRTDSHHLTPGSRKSHWHISTPPQTSTFTSQHPKHTYRRACTSRHEHPVV